jgi:hypothetical protein
VGTVPGARQRGAGLLERQRVIHGNREHALKPTSAFCVTAVTSASSAGRSWQRLSWNLWILSGRRSAGD